MKIKEFELYVRDCESNLFYKIDDRKFEISKGCRCTLWLWTVKKRYYEYLDLRDKEIKEGSYIIDYRVEPYSIGFKQTLG